MSHEVPGSRAQQLTALGVAKLAARRDWLIMFLQDALLNKIYRDRDREGSRPDVAKINTP
jgi:hypothetical protein